MQEIGKRQSQALAVTSAPGIHLTRLFFVTDHSNGLRFLFDTGAEAIVVPLDFKLRKCIQEAVLSHVSCLMSCLMSHVHQESIIP